MKALTICQPWASLIMAGAKPFEFRGWRAPRSMIGQRIVIHAAKRRPDWHECRHLLLALQEGGEIAAETCLHPAIALPILCGCVDELPRSAGLGTAIIGEPRLGTRIAEEFGMPRVNDSDRDQHANWGWPMLDVEVWPEPIPMRGAQGFWHWHTPGDLSLVAEAVDA